MKILLVNDSAALTGGAEIHTLLLRDELRRQGHDARLFASTAGRGEADYQCLGTISRFRTLLQTANPWAAWHFHRALGDFRPDVVHVRMFLTQLSPLILPLLKDIPSLYDVVWYRPICPLGTKMLPNGTTCRVPAGSVCYRNQCLPLRDWLPLTIQMKLWRRWRKVFDLIVANSEAVKVRLIAEGIAPVEVVCHSVATRPARPPLASPPTVGFAGRLIREKGVDVLLRAFATVAARIPEARLLLAGAGPEREYLEGLIASRQLSSSISLLGHLTPLELERSLAPAWVQAVPSRWEEPFGLVAVEAMMRGTAVVASASGGLLEIVRHGESGLLVPPSDPAALAEALSLLLQDRSLAERMGRSGREVALTQFSLASSADRFVQLYRALCQHEKVRG
jgi:glycosyltransferase involved in cell wall biosynthesis